MLVFANIFQPLIDFFEAILKFFHNTVGVGWGLSIILMTVVIRAALVPLTLKQMHSMQRLQRLQPQMKQLQAKYKDDKQRLNQEMMKLYREHDVNPFASCLPMLLQVPVFISLFFMLRHDLRKNICPAVQDAAHKAFVDHQPTAKIGDYVVHATSAGKTVPCGPGHGAGFLFIHDLTNKATGSILIVLIVLYIASQLGSTLLMSTTMDKTQRNLMLFLPLIFVTFVIRFPSGLIVYWITTNLWTVVQQYFVRKRVGPLQPVGVGALAGGDGAGKSADGGGGGLLAGLLGGARAGGDTGGSESPRAGARAAAGSGDTGSKGKATANGAGSSSRGGPPPPSPRKKKKRSGRRR